jgi:hypothetical protein
MDFILPDGKSLRLLSPFADMLNHSPEVEQCHVYDASSGSLSVLAGKDYEPGDQVCSSCSMLVPSCKLTWEHSFRFLSIMGLFRTIAFYVSMALLYQVILMIAMT